MDTMAPPEPSNVDLSLDATQHLPVTIPVFLIYTAMFIVAYWQLWLVHCVGHKRISYQSGFLSLCLVFSALRAVLFSIYIMDLKAADECPGVVYWVLFGLPITMQYFMFALIVSFYYKAYSDSQGVAYVKKNKRMQIFLAFTSFIFLVSHIVSVSLTLHQMTNREEDYHQKGVTPLDFGIVLTRMIISDGLFFTLAILLAFCLYRLTKMNSARLVQDLQGLTRCRRNFIITAIAFLFTLRSIYNIIALCSRQNALYFATDQMDFVSLEKTATFVSFIVLLSFCEIIPTGLLLYRFRIRRPSNVACWPIPCCANCWLKLHQEHYSPEAVDPLNINWSSSMNPAPALISPVTASHSERSHSGYHTGLNGSSSLLSSMMSPRSVPGGGGVSGGAIPERSYFVGTARTPSNSYATQSTLTPAAAVGFYQSASTNALQQHSSHQHKVPQRRSSGGLHNHTSSLIQAGKATYRGSMDYGSRRMRSSDSSQSDAAVLTMDSAAGSVSRPGGHSSFNASLAVGSLSSSGVQQAYADGQPPSNRATIAEQEETMASSLFFSPLSTTLSQQHA